MRAFIRRPVGNAEKRKGMIVLQTCLSRCRQDLPLARMASANADESNEPSSYHRSSAGTREVPQLYEHLGVGGRGAGTNCLKKQTRQPGLRFLISRFLGQVTRKESCRYQQEDEQVVSGRKPMAMLACWDGAKI